MLKYGKRGQRVPVPVGTIAYIVTPQDRRAVEYGAARLTRPWIVEAWQTREYCAARRDSSGRWINSRMAGGHLASVRCLRTGARRVVADWLLRYSLDGAA